MLGTCQYIQVFWVEQWRKFFQAIMPINSCFLSWTMVEIFYKISSVLRCIHLVQFTLILILLGSICFSIICLFEDPLKLLVLILFHNKFCLTCPSRCSKSTAPCCVWSMTHFIQVGFHYISISITILDRSGCYEYICTSRN